MDLLALALAKGYVEEQLKNAGSLKGNDCTIQSVQETDTGNVVTFAWKNEDGNTETTTMTVLNGVNGKNGAKGDKGDKGDAFKYSDFTSAQLEALKVKGDKGDKGDAGDNGKDGAAGKNGTDGKDGNSITAISLVKDETGEIVSGTATLSDNSVIDITITTA